MSNQKTEPGTNPLLVELIKHKYMIWDFKGGDPLHEGFIKEMPLNDNSYKDKVQMFTEKAEEHKTEKIKKPKHKVVYKEADFKALCNDPNIDSADANLDGSQVLLYKGENYYILEGLIVLPYSYLR